MIRSRFVTSCFPAPECDGSDEAEMDGDSPDLPDGIPGDEIGRLARSDAGGVDDDVSRDEFEPPPDAPMTVGGTGDDPDWKTVRAT